jgi:DNA-binding CsgD family transcriptional regulator
LRPPATGDQGLILNCVRPQNSGDDTLTLQLADPNDWETIAYKEQFFALDPFINLAPGAVVTLDQLLPREALEQSEYYLAYLKPAGVFHIMGADTTTDDGTHARLRISRGADENNFDESERSLCGKLIPHLCQAIALHARLTRIESERALYATTIDKLAMGTILLDENAQVVSTNPIAQEILARKDALRIEAGRLRSNDDSQLQELINDAIDSRSQTQPGMARALRLEYGDGLGLGLVIRPVPTSAWAEGQSSPAVAIFLSDPTREQTTSHTTIIELFNLSNAEAALALLLAKGLTLAEASDELHISQHTARAQLKAIFAKTQVSRQAELIRLIINSVATLA